MAKPIKNNLDVFQSYIFTMAKYDFTVYEKRIMYRLVEMAQKDLQGIKFRDNMHQLQPTMEGMDVTMPVADILRNEEDKNYEKAKGAFKSLAKKGMEYEDKNVWLYTSIIEHPKIAKWLGVITFHVYDPVWRCIENFSKGYRKYELLTAMQFKSVYAMRFYEFLSGQSEPKTYINEKFSEFCDILKLSKRMRKPDMFEEKILNVAKKELDEHSPYSFKYERVTIKSRGKTGFKVIGYTFYPVYIQKNRDPELERIELAAKLPAGGSLGVIKKEVYDYLQYNLGWSKETISRNKVTIVAAQETLPDLLTDLSKLYSRGRAVENPVGYVVNGLKAMIKEKGK